MQFIVNFYSNHALILIESASFPNTYSMFFL